MKKNLRIVAVSAGIICAVATVILGWIYIEDIMAYLQQEKTKICAKMNPKND